eukprot:TRINITY_DN7482_c0_g1_i1.p1 TRINITY_DN7482_c0_g1~~TRINITY_DN7482_c0_g1_i1.p1  ORF type:complete len:312 (+),score=36.43 TRINITY_DN7482_c0_g1_i1:120-1055(+)
MGAGNGISELGKKIFLALVFVEAVVLVSLGIARMSLVGSHQFEEVFRYGVLFIVSSLFVAYFAVDGVINENKFTLFAYIFSCLVMLLYVVYQFILTPVTERDTLLWARLIATAVMAPLTSILAILLFRKFGWRIYKKIGADGQLVSMYQTYQIYVTFLRLDLQLMVMLILLVGLFWLKSNFAQTAWFYLDLASLLVNTVLTVVGLIAVRAENKPAMISFLVLIWLVPAYLVARGAELTREHPIDWSNSNDIRRDIQILTILVGILALSNRVFEMIWAVKTWRNFGHGLKERVFARPDDTHSLVEKVPFLTA